MSDNNIVELTKALNQSQAGVSASEVHGMICGYICTGDIENSQAWLEPILVATGLEPNDAEKSIIVLTDIYNEAVKKIQNMQFDFNLLLPDDEDDMGMRAKALGEWCQGFLYGIGNIQQPLPSTAKADTADSDIDKERNEIQDIIHHLTEISQLDFDGINDDEDNEVAYTDLVEYLRMAVLTLFYSVKKIQDVGKGEKVFVHSNKTVH